MTNYSKNRFKAKSQSLVMAGNNCDDSVQMLLCCAMTFVCYSLLCFLLSVRFLIRYCFVSRDNLQIRACLSSVFPPHSRISDRKYST